MSHEFRVEASTFVRRYLMREPDIVSCDICNTLHM